jgi:hypothetical protein
LARVEPRISNHLTAPAQNPGFRHFRHERRRQRVADATLSSKSRLPRNVASWSIVSPMAWSTVWSWRVKCSIVIATKPILGQIEGTFIVLAQIGDLANAHLAK